jgi:hypothetical protein
MGQCSRDNFGLTIKFLLLNFLNIEYIHDVYRRICVIEEVNTKRPTLVFFLAPTKPLQSYG